MQTYRVRPGDRLSTIATLHGVSVEAVVQANPHKTLTRLGSGLPVFASLSIGEDIALPGGLAGEQSTLATVGYYQPLFQGADCQPGFIRDSFGACVLDAGAPAEPVDDPGAATLYDTAPGDYDYGTQTQEEADAQRRADIIAAQAPDAASQVPLPPEDLEQLPPCPLPGFVRDAFAACRDPKDGRAMASAVNFVGTPGAGRK